MAIALCVVCCVLLCLFAVVSQKVHVLGSRVVVSLFCFLPSSFLLNYLVDFLHTAPETAREMENLDRFVCV